ncbi:MAG TPA: (d)CMP kinase [Verrucomicrobiae bacterium]|nr:(d)CMP kinase [Verrucomicrobiae bacterium]
MKQPIVIAIDGTSASGKSTNSKLVARALGFTHVDTGAMYRALAWYCLREKVDLHNPKAVAAACRKWKTTLQCVDHQVQLLVDGYYPAREIRTAEVSEAVAWVAVVPKVRDWMKKKQRECIQFGNLVMEGRDIGTNVFPETDYKFFLDAHLDERSRRRAAQGVQENLAARDERDSQRAAAPLMIALGAKVINNSSFTSAQTTSAILEHLKVRFKENGIELPPAASCEQDSSETLQPGVGDAEVFGKPKAEPAAGDCHAVASADRGHH